MSPETHAARLEPRARAVRVSARDESEGAAALLLQRRLCARAAGDCRRRARSPAACTSCCMRLAGLAVLPTEYCLRSYM